MFEETFTDQIVEKNIPQNKRSWTPEEDAHIKELVERFGTNWSLVQQYVLHRSGKQCRERYYNHLQDNIKKGDWSAEEDSKILSLHSIYGNQWVKIMKELPRRTDNAVKNRFHAIMRALQKSKIKKIGKSKVHPCLDLNTKTKDIKIATIIKTNTPRNNRTPRNSTPRNSTRKTFNFKNTAIKSTTTKDNNIPSIVTDVPETDNDPLLLNSYDSVNLFSPCSLTSPTTLNRDNSMKLTALTLSVATAPYTKVTDEFLDTWELMETSSCISTTATEIEGYSNKSVCSDTTIIESNQTQNNNPESITNENSSIENPSIENSSQLPYNNNNTLDDILFDQSIMNLFNEIDIKDTINDPLCLLTDELNTTNNEDINNNVDNTNWAINKTNHQYKNYPILIHSPLVTTPGFSPQHKKSRFDLADALK